MTSIELTVNGKQVRADVAPRMHLADFLREHLLLTGTHIGCEHGICGACTVEINGEISRSCITYAVSCDGADVRTIEGFDDDALMARLRQAFTREHALQCGYCTPGMLIAARDLVRRRGALSRAEIRTEMSGNLCRCTGYVGIVNAIEQVAAEQQSEAVRSVSAATAWLGPLPGPTAPSTAQAETVSGKHAAVPTSIVREQQPSARAARRIDVTVGKFEQVDGAVQLTQSFVLEHPREAVWKLMSDVEAVARCMPGAALDGPPQDNKVTGRLNVKLGPIAASFAGEGALRQMPSEYRQIIDGQGGDRKSGSRVSGSVDYRLSAVAGSAGREATRVDVTMRYALTGWLAQLGRSALARDLARRIGETFAQNIDAELTDPGGSKQVVAPLRGISLLGQIVVERLRALLARILGRTR